MQTLTSILIQAGLAGRMLTQAQLARLLSGTPQRRHNLVHRALQHGELLQLRRGCYVLAPYLDYKPPHPFVLAQALQPGSYISLESALSFHGWIPEAVHVTMSVVPGRRRLEVDHPVLGLFRFYPLAIQQGHLLDAVDRQKLDGLVALVAQPHRALFDLLCLRKLEFNGLHALTQSMRIDDSQWQDVPPARWQDLQQVYSHKRMTSSLEALKHELVP